MIKFYTRASLILRRLERFVTAQSILHAAFCSRYRRSSADFDNNKKLLLSGKGNRVTSEFLPSRHTSLRDRNTGAKSRLVSLEKTDKYISLSSWRGSALIDLERHVPPTRFRRLQDATAFVGLLDSIVAGASTARAVTLNEWSNCFQIGEKFDPRERIAICSCDNSCKTR